MHFVTGGAFHGKAKWVKEQYRLKENEHSWHSAYKKDPLIEPGKVDIVIFEGVEAWLREWARCIGPDVIRQNWHSLVQDWLVWESQHPQRKFVVIGCDISKGIVPLAPEDRNWRDVTGWVYQDLVSAAERVDIIWYGINQKLK
ncbi:bifunctional adenosylcobinamide kinase/adenosylcobinamide-phosphate guanylyltransferase [Mesobacillus subterraneus]|uniref:Uncharacterized protein n=1 Tax=Mesobacillus subterraneus TaxID=285983 RepID=A0A3R9ECR5_9BACI|nr:bifunctional adenosylcobinamide kinase/adenosylcobinamide-phosphate guanylyltransferase [Mesobacillus subterraneus]RSD28949.1 hypothetical protein EJA10_02225 [Mesobacillus subterraneus]